MRHPTAQQILQHWAATPQDLREAMHDPAVIDQVAAVAQSNHLRETKEDQLGRLVRAVFLGILSLEDLNKEIQSTLGIDARLALGVYQQLDQKIFSSYRQRVEENYRSQTTRETTSADEEGPLYRPQVVLKETPATVLNLRTQSPLPQTPPTPIVIKPDTLPSAVSQTPPVFSPTIVPPPAPAPVSKPASSNATPKPQESAPFMLHQKEDLKTVGSMMPSVSYKQNTFGGFGGSFRSPFTKKDSLSATKVEVEMPFDNQETTPSSVPVSVKQTAGSEPAKTVHYTASGSSSANPTAPVAHDDSIDGQSLL